MNKDAPAYYNNLDVGPDYAEPHVLIALPTRGDVCMETTASLYNMARHTKLKTIIYPSEGFTVAENRTRCVAVAMKDKMTHILWVDSDMGFPGWSLDALMEWKVPVIGANYPRKTVPPTPTAYADTDDYTGPLYSEIGATGIEQVKHIGFGLCLTHMAVFDKLMQIREGDNPPFFHQEPMKGGNRWCTEDVYFAHRCFKAGVPIYVDHDVSNAVIHVGKIHYDNRWTIAGRNIQLQRGRGENPGFGKEDFRRPDGSYPDLSPANTANGDTVIPT
jgi:hypothetical protein